MAKYRLTISWTRIIIFSLFLAFVFGVALFLITMDLLAAARLIGMQFVLFFAITTAAIWWQDRRS